jgi:glycine/D-amino acid oxidase-like deaminating enzyme
MTDGQADLVVIGGGIVGTWTAYSATRAFPAWRVVLLERSMIGGGTTAFSLGLSVAMARNDRQRALAIDSVRAYETLARRTGQLPGRTIPLMFVVSRSGLPGLQSRLYDGAGAVCGAREEAAFRTRFPDLRIGPDEILVDGAPARRGDPREGALRLARLVARHPRGEVWEGATVTTMEHEGSRVRVRIADGRHLTAAGVVVSTGPLLLEGPWAAAARNLRIRVKKIVALHLQQTPQPDDPVIFFPEVDAFLLPAPEREQWLFSYTSGVWDCDPDPLAGVVTEHDRATGLSMLHDRWPSLAATCCGGRASCDGYAADWTPVIQSIDPAGRIVVAGACSGSGARLAPAIGAAAAQLVSRARA